METGVLVKMNSWRRHLKKPAAWGTVLQLAIITARNAGNSSSASINKF